MHDSNPAATTLRCSAVSDFVAAAVMRIGLSIEIALLFCDNYVVEETFSYTKSTLNLVALPLQCRFVGSCVRCYVYFV